MAPKEGTPPPVIGKVGRYTVFITPKPGENSPLSTPSPKPSQSPKLCPSPSPRMGPALMPAFSPSQSLKTPPSPPPSQPPAVAVQVPPKQFDTKPVKGSDGSVFGFFWDAVAKVRDVHSNLDEYLADWFGLDQSRYQWALNDYYESKGADKEGGKQKGITSKGQGV